MAEDTDHAVARQVRAWNEGDLEVFLACFREDVVVEDADGNVQSMGRDALRTTYGQLLADQPDREYNPAPWGMSAGQPSGFASCTM